MEFTKIDTSAIESLHKMLEEAKIPHVFHDHFGGKRIAYPDKYNWKISCVQFWGAHGAEEGFIEALGLGCDTEPYTALQLFKKIKKDYQNPLDK